MRSPTPSVTVPRVVRVKATASAGAWLTSVGCRERMAAPPRPRYDRLSRSEARTTLGEGPPATSALTTTR